MESKWLIYELMPRQYCPLTLLFKCGTNMLSVMNAVNHNSLKFPLIAKPDVGSKGVLVKKVNNENELADYVNKMKVDFLLQAYIEYKNEIGILYYRIPGEERGRISGMVGKEFLKVTGDGKSSIAELIINEPRSLLQLAVLKNIYGNILQAVLNLGEEYMMVPYGNHARGARFIDMSDQVTDQLTRTIDHVCRQIPGFYFGRMDIMYDNWEELNAGKNFSIVELNGAGSEPTHIYDPAHSIFFAYKEIIWHLKVLNQISAGNRQREGLRYMNYREGMAMLKNNARYLKLVS